MAKRDPHYKHLKVPRSPTITINIYIYIFILVLHKLVLTDIYLKDNHTFIYMHVCIYNMHNEVSSCSCRLMFTINLIKSCKSNGRAE